MGFVAGLFAVSGNWHLDARAWQTHSSRPSWLIAALLCGGSMVGLVLLP